MTMSRYAWCYIFVSGAELSVDVVPIRRKLYVACNRLNGRSHGLAEPVRVNLLNRYAYL